MDEYPQQLEENDVTSFNEFMDSLCMELSRKKGIKLRLKQYPQCADSAGALSFYMVGDRRGREFYVADGSLVNYGDEKTLIVGVDLGEPAETEKIVKKRAVLFARKTGIQEGKVYLTRERLPVGED